MSLSEAMNACNKQKPVSDRHLVVGAQIDWTNELLTIDVHGRATPYQHPVSIDLPQ